MEKGKEKRKRTQRTRPERGMKRRRPDTQKDIQAKAWIASVFFLSIYAVQVI